MADHAISAHDPFTRHRIQCAGVELSYVDTGGKFGCGPRRIPPRQPDLRIPVAEHNTRCGAAGPLSGSRPGGYG